MTFLTTSEALLQYSEWLDGEGLIVSDRLGDIRTHEELVRGFLKPEEPTGVGAVVEAVHNNQFVRIDRGDVAWRRVGDIDTSALCGYQDIDVVRVLNKGVS